MLAVTVPVTFFEGRIVRPVNAAKPASTSLMDAFSQLIEMRGSCDCVGTSCERRFAVRGSTSGAAVSRFTSAACDVGCCAGCCSSACDDASLARRAVDLPRLELLGAAIDADVHFAVLLRDVVRMRRIEREHDANDALREL